MKKREPWNTSLTNFLWKECPDLKLRHVRILQSHKVIVAFHTWALVWPSTASLAQKWSGCESGMDVVYPAYTVVWDRLLPWKAVAFSHLMVRFHPGYGHGFLGVRDFAYTRRNPIQVFMGGAQRSVVIRNRSEHASNMPRDSWQIERCCCAWV